MCVVSAPAQVQPNLVSDVPAMMNGGFMTCALVSAFGGIPLFKLGALARHSGAEMSEARIRRTVQGGGAIHAECSVSRPRSNC